MHGVMVLQCDTAATGQQRVQQQQQQQHNQLCPPPYPPTQITTDPARLPSSGCRPSGHDESPDAVGGTGEVMRVGRAGMQLAIVAPRSMSHPALGDSYCAVQRQAWAGVCRPSRRGLSLHYLVRLRVPQQAASPAAVRANACVPQPFSLPPAAGCSVQEGRGRLPFRGDRITVCAKPSTMKTSPTVCRVHLSAGARATLPLAGNGW